MRYINRLFTYLPTYLLSELLVIAHQHIDARYWYSNSVRPSICPWRYGSGIRWKRLSILS